MKLPQCNKWGTPTIKMPNCPKCDKDELGMIYPNYALCYFCGYKIWGILMEKPKRKILKPTFEGKYNYSQHIKMGYNKACNEWEIYHKQELDKAYKEIYRLQAMVDREMGEKKQ